MAKKQKPEFLLKELGSKLHNDVPSSKHALLKILKQAATALSELDQSPPKSVLTSIQPFVDAIAKSELLKNQDREVMLLVANCICEITRISAPEAPYSDEVLKEIFHLIVSTFSGLADINCPSFVRRVLILKTLERYKSCVMMLDLECDDLVKEMFRTFLDVASDGHPESVLQSMQTIMVVLLEESEEIHEDLLLILLSVLGRKRKDIKMAAKRLAMNVIQHCSGKLDSAIRQFLISSMSGDNRSSSNQIEYHEVIYDIYRCAPQVLSGVVPYLIGELLTDKIDIRLKAVELAGELFGLPDSEIYEAFQPIFLEFLKRLTDRVVEVRMSVLEHVKNCLLSNPSRAEAPQIISALYDRLLDYDESIRKQVVAVVCDVACSSLTTVPVEAVKLVAERLRDKSLLVKEYTMERLADIYSLYCLKCSDGSTLTDEYDWIPAKILRCFYDKDFRSDTVESILCSSLFPPEFSAKDKVGNWVRVFLELDKVEVKSLEKILEQKQRLQQEMLRYLSLRQINQENDTPEIKKKVMFCFRVMSRCFTDSEKAEENFWILDQLKDANVWRILTSLLDPNTTCTQIYRSRDDMLKILGEKHRLYEFLSSLSLKVSYMLFSKEHVKEILLEVDRQRLFGNAQLTLSCMNILVILACSSPLLLSGIEEDLVRLLEDENEVIKEGVLHVLAKAGGTIRDQLGASSSSLDLILERICLEGSRRQAKYAVHALAAVTKDDGLMSLSVLYKRLVDMLEEKANLPAVLQSLGCIAQIAMPIFETRENDIEGFIKQQILMCNHISENKANEYWDERSELCSLKIFGWKTLVKSYLPVRDAHLRLGIDDLLGMLRNVVSFGEISKDIKSSSVDKAHLKLAGAKSILRLSKHWDHKIPTDLFYQTLRIMKINFPQVKKQFLNKVHQYIKDRLLDPKYACAFIYNIGSLQLDFEEEKHKLFEIIQMCQQGKACQQPVQSDSTSSMVYPEFILPYWVHALAHHFSCPSIDDENKDFKAFEPMYRQMYLFLSMLVHGDEDVKSEVSIKKKKETILLVTSILHGIKRSEDLTDTTKSMNSHAICDLGLSIIKRLAPEQDKVQELSSNPFLPPGLYKEYETKEGDEPLINGKKTWLADDSVLGHFESLQLEANGPAFKKISDDEMDSVTDSSEVPLGKMIKRLRAKGIKAKKVVKDVSIVPEFRKENEFDILKMVREIDSDNVGLSGSFEPSNGHEYVPRKVRNDLKRKKNKRVASESENVPVTKRRRSSYAQGHYKFSLPKGSLKGLVRPSADSLSQKDDSLSESTENDEQLPSSFEVRYSMSEHATEVTESDHLGKSSGFSLQNKGRDYTKERNGVQKAEESSAQDLKKSKQLTDTDSIHDGSTKKKESLTKRKRKSISGLAKCNTKEGASPTTDLVDCRLRIWWPMDKKFYEGVVKSYDQNKNKHVIKYDDGDVEVLCLDKERWELVENGQQAIKRGKLSKNLPAKRLSAERRKNSLDASTKSERQTTSSPSKVRGKRTPRKNLKHRQTLVSKCILSESCEEWSKRNLNISESEPAKTSKPEDFETEENQSKGIKESISVHMDPVKHENSVTGEQQEEDAESNSTERDSSKEDDKEDVTHSEETQEADASKEKCGEISNEIERCDLHGNQAEAVNAHSIFPNKSERTASDASDSKAAEISDDEPLGVWKCRAGKLVEGK